MSAIKLEEGWLNIKVWEVVKFCFLCNIILYIIEGVDHQNDTTYDNSLWLSYTGIGAKCANNNYILRMADN